MTKYVTIEDQQWQQIDVRGVAMEACRLWEGNYNVRSGFFRMPKGMQIPIHHHDYWVQVFVMHGKMEVQAQGDDVHVITEGGYYFVEPGETHTETALEETLLLVVSEEERKDFRRYIKTESNS
ncbi:cupin domain-containing protein [Legionella gratiana]|uniref:cupin domain-containing protein n=1 Tax=Legionella gratiana TaxID=45066 RepID=UPI00073185F1|nr:cupin domain-containing protein [Legionella gratiana]